MSAPAAEFSVHVEHLDGFSFRTSFDKIGMPAVVTDEPPPLGRDAGPNPARLLAAAVGNCLAASLLFCLSKAKVKPSSLSAEVKVELVRNEHKRLRIGRLDVTLHPELAEGGDELLRCLDFFEDFCVVTESVREGLDVQVHVAGVPALARSEAAAAASADAR
jgi:uncharacterized OsmC-like protein